MYAASFDYYRARSLADAQQLLAAHPGAKLLAGGHSLLPLHEAAAGRAAGRRRHRPGSGAARHHAIAATSSASAR